VFGAPPESLGLVDIPQIGWITGTLFLKALDHVKKIPEAPKKIVSLY